MLIDTTWHCQAEMLMMPVTIASPSMWTLCSCCFLCHSFVLRTEEG